MHDHAERPTCFGCESGIMGVTAGSSTVLVHSSPPESIPGTSWQRCGPPMELCPTLCRSYRQPWKLSHTHQPAGTSIEVCVPSGFELRSINTEHPCDCSVRLSVHIKSNILMRTKTHAGRFLLLHCTLGMTGATSDRTAERHCYLYLLPFQKCTRYGGIADKTGQSIPLCSLSSAAHKPW